MANTSPNQQLVPVGVDDGHFAIKVTRNVDGKLVSSSIRSQAWVGRQTTASFGINGTSDDDDCVYEVADGEYVTVSTNSVLNKSMDTRSDDYPTSSLNRALVVHGMASAGLADSQVSVVSGLPIDRFFVNGTPNNDLITAKRQSLLRPIKRVANSPIKLVSIERHQVLSEAVAAYFDAAYDANGNVNEPFMEISKLDPVAVVDVGGATTDIAVVKEGGRGLYAQLSGTAEIGALNLRDNLNTMLRQRFQLSEQVSEAHIDRLIQTGKYRLYGEIHDLGRELEQHINEFGEQVGFEVNRLLGSAISLGCVLFVGGGAELLGNRLDIVFPRLPAGAVTVHDNPTYANSRGMYKAALLSSQGNG